MDTSVRFDEFSTKRQFKLVLNSGHLFVEDDSYDNVDDNWYVIQVILDD